MVARKTPKAKTKAPDNQVKNRRVGYKSPPVSVETQFKPGQSGNPAGRPKRRTLSERIDDLLNGDKLDGCDVPKGACVADVLAAAILRQALAGSFPFAKEVYDRIEGKVADRIAGHDGGPLTDLSGLTDHDLDTLDAIAGRVAPRRPGGVPEGR